MPTLALTTSHQYRLEKKVQLPRVPGLVTLLLLDTLNNGLVEIFEIQTSVVAPGPRCDQGHRLVEQHLESRSHRLHPEVDVTHHVLYATVDNKQKTFLKILLYANFDRVSVETLDLDTLKK